jgi:hypothetical protein
MSQPLPPRLFDKPDDERTTHMSEAEVRVARATATVVEHVSTLFGRVVTLITPTPLRESEVTEK